MPLFQDVAVIVVVVVSTKPVIVVTCNYHFQELANPVRGDECHLLFEKPFSLGKQCLSYFRFTLQNFHMHFRPRSNIFFLNTPFCAVYDATEKQVNKTYG